MQEGCQLNYPSFVDDIFVLSAPKTTEEQWQVTLVQFH